MNLEFYEAPGFALKWFLKKIQLLTLRSWRFCKTVDFQTSVQFFNDALDWKYLKMWKNVVQKIRIILMNINYMKEDKQDTWKIHSRALFQSNMSSQSQSIILWKLQKEISRCWHSIYHCFPSKMLILDINTSSYKFRQTENKTFKQFSQQLHVFIRI